MSNGYVAHRNGDMGGKQRDTRRLTPKYIPEALGQFDLDPCGAPGWEIAELTYLLENGDDGLRDPWFGRVWLNPPYGKELTPFLSRLADHGRGTALTFAATDTRWFHDYIYDRATAILFLKGRVTLLREDGTPFGANGGAASCLTAYGIKDAIALAKAPLKGHFESLR